jgi:hypothetical protein
MVGSMRFAAVIVGVSGHELETAVHQPLAA